MRTGLFVLFVASLAGCSANGPATTDTSSSSLPNLASKVEFLQRYVTFRRSYEELEFHVNYFNGGSSVPSPSQWDVRLVARAPANELDLWIPKGVDAVAETDVEWLSSVPNAANAGGITEWYPSPRRVVGIDRKRNVVAYRSWTE